MSETRTATPRLNRFDARKRHFIRKRRYAEQFDGHGLPVVAQQLRDCEETEVLACCSHCGKSWYIANRCRLRVCPLCSYRVAQQRSDYMLAMTAAMTYPKLITLTMPRWKDDPREGIRYLRKSWNALRRTKEFRNVVGGAYQIELKAKPNGWHIHIHALVDAPYLPYQRLYSLWRNIIGVDAPQVDIRAAKSADQRVYVCKYAAKAADFFSDPSLVVEWYKATKGLRLFGTFGKWFNAKLAELPHTGHLIEHVPKCPFCQAERTMFFARDGPFLFGGKNWVHLERAFCEDKEFTRPIKEVRDKVEAIREKQTQL